MIKTSVSSEYFERVAPDWDELREGYFSEAVREVAIAKAYLRPEMVVADVGAGRGFMTADLVPLVSRVYALDASDAMLDVAKRKLGNLEKVVLKKTDGRSLPLEDGSIDAAFANMYLHHCDDPEAAIREMVRILRPGGRLVLTDIDAHTHQWMREEMADLWLGFERSQVRSWLRNACLVNIMVDGVGSTCDADSEDREQAATVDGMARISVFVAAASLRVAGVREAVSAGYGARVEGVVCGCSVPTDAQQSCCSPDSVKEEVLFRTGYTADELAGVPKEAAGLSLGCGNPIAMASLSPGEVVLDIGSGGGIDVFAAARRVGPSGRAIGLDMTQAMIGRARRSAAAAGLENVEFRLGQAEAMPVENEEVHVVLSNCVINLCEDKGKVFEEAYRVLKPGGRLTISDMVSDGSLPTSLRQDPTQWAGCVHGALPEQEYLELIAQAGFDDIVPTRSGIGGTIEGVPVFSLAVSARKGERRGTP